MGERRRIKEGEIRKWVVWKMKNREGGLMELADGAVRREMKAKMRANRLWSKREGNFKVVPMQCQAVSLLSAWLC